MTVDKAILGFLHDAPRSGYALKKAFSDSELLYWSGNNNQVYTALLRLEREGFVRSELLAGEAGPARKEYSVTPAGEKALAAWAATAPEIPQVRSPFLIQLLWGDELPAATLRELLAAYEEQLRGQVALLHERARRDRLDEHGSTRQKALRRAVHDRWEAIYQGEMEWAHALRRELDELPEVDSGRQLPQPTRRADRPHLL
jgi:DNA-binding PadR family transcriptional regulator